MTMSHFIRIVIAPLENGKDLLMNCGGYLRMVLVAAQFAHTNIKVFLMNCDDYYINMYFLVT